MPVVLIRLMPLRNGFVALRLVVLQAQDPPRRQSSGKTSAYPGFSVRLRNVD